MAVDVGSAKGYLDLDISGFLANLKSAQSEAENTSKNMATKIGNNLTGAGKKLTSAGTTLTKTVTLPIVGTGAAIVKTSADFESAMSKVQAISGATGTDFDKLNAKAQEMGAKTKFSATESAEAFTYMAMAGWKTEDMLAGIDGIMNLAAADGLDLATTSDIVTDALTAFGLGAEDSAHFADVLAKASSSANTNVSMLGESFKYVAPVAGALGYSAEDTAVALGLMANAGIKGSQGGTALRASLSRLIKPTDEVAALMEEYNLSLTNSDGTMKSLGEVMDMLRTNLGDLTEAEQAQIAAELFGQEAMSGMLSIINASEKDYENLTNQIYNADGAAQQMADTMLNNLSGQITILKSSIEGLALQFGEILLPYVKQGVEWFQNLVQKFQGLSTEQKEQIVKWAAIAAAVGPALVVLGKIVTVGGKLFTTFGKISSGFSKLSGGFKAVTAGGKAGAGMLAKFGGALAGVTGPVIAVVAVIAVLAAAFVSLWKNNEDFRNKIIEIWEQVKQSFQKLADGIVERLNSLGFNFSSITEVIKAIWTGFCNFLAPIFEGAFQFIADTFEFVVNMILGVLDFFISLFKGDWEGCWNAIKSIFEGIWNGIKAFFSNILNTIKGILNVVLNWFGTNWNKCWTSIKTFFINTWNSIKTWFTNTLNSIKSTASNIWNNIKTTISNAIENAKSKVTTAVNGIKTTFSNGFNAAKNTVTSIFDGIKNKISTTIENAKSIVSNGIAKLKSFFNFSWSLPKLKLPHFSISGSFSLNPPSVPSFSIEWYKKAMNGGMILNSPTIFGYNSATGRFLGAGEAGSETVVGTESLMSMIRQSVTESIKPLVSVVYQLANTTAELGYVTKNGFTKQAERMQWEVNKFKNESGKGDTYNFYSPKPIDEIEAARQIKKTKRELAEGF